jgi:hypothetical protein
MREHTCEFFWINRAPSTRCSSLRYEHSEACHAARCEDIEPSGRATMRMISSRVITLLLLLTAVCAFVPLKPGMPGGGLDESWQIALNQAYAQGLHFGTDIVFTSGPFASVYTAMYHPGTDFLMMAGCSYLALCYFLCLHVLTRGRSWRAGLLLAVVVGGVLVSRDALLFSYLPMVGLVAFQLGRRESLSMPPSVPMRPMSISIIVGTLFFSFGLLPLAKGSLIAICAATMLLGAFWFASQRRPWTALICLVSPFIGTLVCWTLAGQPLNLLPDFFVNMKPLIAGYPEAMGNGQGNLQIVFYLVAASGALAAIFHRYRREAIKAIYLFGLFAAVLFVTFKLGFMRRDENHSAVAASMLVLVAGLLLIELRSRVALVAFGVALASWAVIEKGDTAKLNVALQLEETYASAIEGLVSRIRDPHALERQFEAAMVVIRTQEPLPRVRGDTDIYSAHQAALIASGNRWSPRPALQSYPVYEPTLAELNRRHLVGAAAPENIFFSMETIDNRLPMLDDGASWPLLLSNYIIVDRHGPFVVLHRKGVLDVSPDFHVTSSSNGQMGELVSIPKDDAPLFAQIDVEPTLVGRIGSLLLKPTTIDIEVTLTDGTTHHYRFIPGSAKSAFMISPLVETTDDFAKLFESDNASRERKVQSFRLLPNGRRPAFWRTQFQVRFGRY